MNNTYLSLTKSSNFKFMLNNKTDNTINVNYQNIKLNDLMLKLKVYFQY